jgi:methionyl-tRNA formyltransferase
MSEKMDAGEILAREKIKIEDGDTVEVLTKKLSRLGETILIKNLPEWISGKIKTEKQNDKLVIFCRPIRREEGLVDWKKTAQEIYDKWRALHPWPGLYTSARLKNGIKRLKLLEISIDPVVESGEKPGKVIEYNHKSAVQSGKGIVFLKTVQLEGKNAAGIDDFQRGYPDFTVV